jgi:hypothetical protein
MVAAGDEVNASDLTTLEDLTIRRPMVRLVQAVAQSIPDNTGTAITFTTEDLDTYGFHDPVTNNTRITPSVAGWYRFHGTYFTSTPTFPAVPNAMLACYMRKNLSTVPPGSRTLPVTNVVSPSVACTALVEMNGTTDYMEFVGLQDSSGALNTAISAYIASTFECVFVANS